MLAQLKNFQSSVAAVAPVLEAADGVTEQQRKLAVNVCLQAGGRALAVGDATTASQAYAMAEQHADDSQQPTAMLGDAWAAVLRRDQPLEAAEKLENFCQQFPLHAEAPAPPELALTAIARPMKHNRPKTPPASY